MGREFSLMLMEIDIRVHGYMIKDMDKVPTIGMMGIDILGNLKTIL